MLAAYLTWHLRQAIPIVAEPTRLGAKAQASSDLGIKTSCNFGLTQRTTAVASAQEIAIDQQDFDASNLQFVLNMTASNLQFAPNTDFARDQAAAGHAGRFSVLRHGLDIYINHIISY